MCLSDWARGWAWFQIHTLEKLLELICEFSEVAGFKSNTQIHTFVGSVCCSVALWMFLFIPSFLRALILIIQPVVLWIWLFSLSIVLLQFMIECFLLLIPFYPSLSAWKSVLYYYLLMISFGRWFSMGLLCFCTSYKQSLWLPLFHSNFTRMFVLWTAVEDRGRF